MSTSIAALLGFVAITLALVATIVSYRLMMIVTGKTAVNSWTRGAQTWDDAPIITRIGHAHLNCLENLPLFAAVILTAAATNQLAVTDPLACWYLAARGAQVLTHLIGTSAVLVFIRANFLIVGWLMLGYWLLKLAGLV